MRELKTYNKLIPEDRKLTRYKTVNGHYELRRKPFNRCWRLWSSPVITYDGQIVPCCFDKNAEYPIGKITSGNFRDIWYGDKFRDFRTEILKNRNSVEMCRNCTSGQTVFL